MASSTPKNPEEAFLADNGANLARMNQILTCILPFAYVPLYGVDLFLTHLIVPLPTLFAVRTAIIVFHLAYAATTFTPIAKRSENLFAVLTLAISAVGILILTILTGGTESPYDEALVVALFMMSTFLPWRFKYFAPTAFFCGALYPLMLTVSGTLGDTSVWVSHVAIMFVCSALSSATSFVLERLRRSFFTSRMQLDSKSRDLEHAMHSI